MVTQSDKKASQTERVAETETQRKIHEERKEDRPSKTDTGE